MALTINIAHKTNTVASVSGTTFTSNGTPFASGDVGRSIVFTNGPAIGQIRRIVGYTSTTVVTVDSAWDESPFPEFTDSLPVAGNTWQINLTFEDIYDGVHIIRDSPDSYRQVAAAGLVTIDGVFLADTSKNLVLNCEAFKTTTTARVCLGYLHPAGYGMYGCSIVDLSTTITGGWSVSSGDAGDLHLYGCNVSASLTATPFWRLYRGGTHIVRFVDCDFNGNFAGRVQGSRSALMRCTYRGNTSASAISGIGAIAPFGLISECRVQASYQAVYCAFTLGVGTVTSPTFGEINGRLFRGSEVLVDNTYVIEDYRESEVSAPSVTVNAADTRAGAILSFRQWVSTSMVNAALAAVTDSARRVIRNGAASVVDNVTTTSGSFTRYTAEVRRFSMVLGDQAWSAGTAYGPYEEAVASYAWQPQVLSLPLAESSDVTFTMIPDPYITETNQATVDAYAEISNLDRLYDRYKSWFVDNLDIAYPSFGAQKITGGGATLDCSDADIVIDGTAGSAFTVNTGTNTITIKATTFAAGATFAKLTTTGSITFQNGAAPSATIVYESSAGVSVPVTVSGVRDGTKVRIIRTDTSAELAIGNAGASGYATRLIWSTDLPIRADTAYVSGLDAEQEASALGTLTANGAGLTIVQAPCTIYEGNGINGSTVTGLTLDVPNIEIDADEADNAMTVQEIYAWFKHTLMGDDGIRTLFGGITPESAHKYRVNTAVAPLKIDQKDLVNSLVLSGGLLYRDDGTSVRLAGSGVIEFVVDDVYESQAAEQSLAAIQNLVEADEIHTATTVEKRLKGTATPLLTKNWTGTPLSTFQAVEPP